MGMTIRCDIFIGFLMIVMFSLELVHTRHLKGLKRAARGNKKELPQSFRENLLWNLILTQKIAAHKESARSRHSVGSKKMHQHIRHHQQAKERKIYDQNNKSTMDIYRVPLNVGLCSDQHPQCASFALNGMCDWPELFQNLHDIHMTCPFSCGYCKENVSGGEVDFVGDDWTKE
ncbi:uncharacterized protein [Montipora capricornis]|uniref:uncharacterized protein n=1 Tax=Montipora capricornis TaxID=246305 RepID=UPI0035F1FA50